MNKDEMIILNEILKLVAKLIAETDANNDIAQTKRKSFSIIEAKKNRCYEFKFFYQRNYSRRI